MALPDADERLGPATLVIETLAEPERTQERLPQIVGMFDEDDRYQRVCAAWMCCLVAAGTDDEQTLEYLVRRLVDRLDGDVSLELTTTLDYISTRHAGHVGQLLSAIAAEDGGPTMLSVGSFTRDHYQALTDTERPTTADEESNDRSDDEESGDHADEDSADDAHGGPGAAPEENEGPPDRESDERADDEPTSAEPGGTMAGQRTDVRSIAAASGFEKLHVLASRRRSRYADVYESLASRGGEERALALRLLYRPDDADDPLAFERRIQNSLDGWESVSEHSHVVSVFDWDVDPRPWLVTVFTGESLARADVSPDGDVDSSPAAVAGEAADLARGLCHLHGRGVVHGGIDPRNVVYSEEILGGKRVPLLDNVGLAEAFRFHFDPALCLDPRYAAPEYFDDGYGQIDHATDIYQLGAVVYYRATGQPPFEGAFDTVRNAVLDLEPTPPSSVRADLPPELDDIVAKAMAKPKLNRYETAEHLQRELASVGADNG